MNIVLGADIGGTHITAGLIDLDKKMILPGSLKRKAINPLDSKEIILQGWASLLKQVIGNKIDSDTRIGIAMPGPMDYREGICLIQMQDKFTSLYGINLKTCLSSLLTIRPENIRFDNDALCFLKGEVWLRESRSNVLGITLGTGLGSAYSVDGLISDANLWCSPFLNGIAEDFLSTRWFVNRFMELTGVKMTGVIQIAQTTEYSNDAERVFDEFGKNLNLFLATMLKIQPASQIIIGGNIACSFPRFISHLKDLKAEVIFSEIGEAAAICGAACG